MKYSVSKVGINVVEYFCGDGYYIRVWDIHFEVIIGEALERKSYLRVQGIFHHEIFHAPQITFKT